MAGHIQVIIVLTKPYLCHVAAVIEKHGWVSQTEAYDSGKESTAGYAFHNMFPSPERIWHGLVVEYDQTHQQKAKEAVDWILSHDGQEDLTDYMHNLLIICKQRWFGYEHLGYVASIIRSFEKHLEREAKKKYQAQVSKDSSHVGTVGERREFTLTLLSVTNLYGKYGVTQLHRFIDQDGNLLVWFSSAMSGMEPHTTYRVKATVKEHSEYREQAQTVLTRVAVQEKVGNN